MPKKSSTLRAGAQRPRPKAQKSIALVRPDSAEDELVDERAKEVEETTEERYAPALSPAVTSSALAEEVQLTEQKSAAAPPVAKGSASARLAARRQGTQKAQAQRNAGSLVTAEHFAYVRKDLVFIAVLAVIMITIIVTSYFLFGRGA